MTMPNRSRHTFMPDMTIPAALLISIGVIVGFGLAVHSGDYRYAAAAGVVGTLANLVFFYRRLHMQMRAEMRRRELQKAKQDEKPTA